MGFTVSADAGIDAFQEVGGMVVMEGENFHAADGRTDENSYEWRISDTQAGFVGTGYVDTPGPKGTNGEWANACEVTYEINFSTPGQYYVWVRRYALSNASNSCLVGLDGDQDTREQNNSDYNQWIWYLADDPIEVTAGLHTFNLRRRESQYGADRILLTTDSAFTPTGDGPPESSFDSPGEASDPFPADEETYVPRDVTLSWTPGEFAPPVNGHKVYFSEIFDDVNDSVGGITQDANNYTLPQRLDFGKTYYWRVDEVDGAPDFAVHQGNVWSFRTEPVGYPIENVTTTASSSAPTQGPASTVVDGSGLTDDLHSTETLTMWSSAFGAPQPTWIQFELDRVYPLHEMWVWNSNSTLEPDIGYGFRDVTIEYSLDGVEFETLGTTHEFTQAPGADGYAHNTTIDFGGVQAKYVKLTVNTNWAAFTFPQFGLSEVRFFHIPMRAGKPQPDAGATDVPVDMTLSWRAGREAITHDLYLDTDQQAVTDRTIQAVSLTDASYASLLDLDSTYYWRIDEVSEATTSQGDVWSFSTQEYLVVEDFESYNDIDPPDPESHTIFESWPDGYQSTTNGALIGNDPPDPSYAETVTVHGGEQSMPMFYSNTGSATFSEATRTFANPQDWAAHGITTLAVWLHGTAGNTGQLYVKINGARIPYDGDPGDIALAGWQLWNIDLTTSGLNLQSVSSLTIGVDGVGTGGTLYVDDIVLYRLAPVPPSEWRVRSSSDDAEEHGDWDAGAMEDLASTDMEMPYEDAGMGEIQIIGLRFTGIPIPRGATITEAWVQFQVDDPKDGTQPVNLTIEGELSANSATFSDTVNDISSRPTTTAQVQWSVPNWVAVGDHGPDQATPNIASIIQEIVNQPDWSGGAIVLMFRDNPASPSLGIRSAVSFDGDPSAAAMLHIGYE
jgi:hypothetical protein